MAPDKKITGRLKRLHSSRVRLSETPSSGEETESRVFLAADVQETETSKETSPETAFSLNETQEHGGFASEFKAFPGEHRHGNKPLASFLEWTDPTSVLGLGETPPERILFLDIETAGLRNDDAIICVGAAWWNGTTLETTVWNLLEEEAEGRMLRAFAETASSFASVCTFNGKSFDIPRLKKRFERFAIRSPFDAMGHIDLVLTARRQLPRQNHALGLQTLERTQLRFHREDDLPGSEVPRRWKSYLASGNPSLLHDVIEHNLLDVVSLAALLGKFARGAQLALPIKSRAKNIEREDRQGGSGSGGEGRRARSRSVRPRPASAPSLPSASSAPELSPMQKKLARSYQLRSKSSGGAPTTRQTNSHSRTDSEAPTPPTNNPELLSPTLPTRERAALLRRSIQEALDAGQHIEAVAAHIFELVAIAPRHAYGLEMLAAYYTAIGAKACARDIQERLSRLSPY